MGCDSIRGLKEPATTAELRVKVLLQKLRSSPTENDLNEIDSRDDSAWANQGERSSKVQNNPGREFVIADRQVSARSFLVILRYDYLTRQIDETWRFRRLRPGLPAQNWNIESVTNWNELNLWIMVRCTVQE